MNVSSFVKRRGLAAAGIIALTAVAAVLSVPRLRWRVEVVALHLAGKIPDIEFGELIGFMMPGSDQSMTRLIQSATRTPSSRIPTCRMRTSPPVARSTARAARAAMPRMVSGGPGAPGLVGREYVHGAGDWAIYRTIRFGVPNTAMPAHTLEPTHLWQLVAFVRSIDTRAGGGASAAAKPLAVSVTAAELEAVEYPREDWLTYSGSFASTRHSSLSQITPDNVRELGLRWQHQFEGDPGKVETSPIVRHGIMFVMVPPGRDGVDAGTGRGRRGKQQHRIPAMRPAENSASRSIGAWRSWTIASTSERAMPTWSHAMPPPARSCGTWRRRKIRQAITSARLRWHSGTWWVTGVGTNGRGIAYIAAFDANDGRERWRFKTIPGPGEPGHDTWAGDSWREGGAPTWLTRGARRRHRRGSAGRARRGTTPGRRGSP